VIVFNPVGKLLRRVSFVKMKIAGTAKSTNPWIAMPALSPYLITYYRTKS